MGVKVTIDEVNKTGQRHYGIDALRILAMFLVVVLHILNFGGVLSAAKPYYSPTGITTWVLAVLAMSCVNCYGLISGYVGIYSKYRYSNLLLLLLQVWLYSIGITLFFCVTDPGSVDKTRVLQAFFPVMSTDYWYVSAYVGLNLFIPGLNFLIHHLNRGQAKALCLSMVLVFCVLPHTLFDNDPFYLGMGYSTMWLIVLYILGGCIRKFGFLQKIRIGVLAAVCVSAVLLAVASKFLLHSEKIKILSELYPEDVLIKYTAPTILALSMGVLLMFAKRPKPGRITAKIIGWFAPVAFGVYLIHLHQDLYQRIFLTGRRFAPLGQKSPVVMVLGVLASAAGIFLVCALIDKMRLWVFEKLRLRQRLRALEERLIPDLWNTDTEE